MHDTLQEIENQLLELTQRFLYESHLGKRKVKLDHSIERHLGLGSLARLELFFEIEKQFDIQFSDQVLGELNTLRDISDQIYDDKTIKNTAYKIEKNEKADIEVDSAKTLIDILLLYAEKD